MAWELVGLHTLGVAVVGNGKTVVGHRVGKLLLGAGGGKYGAGQEAAGCAWWSQVRGASGQPCLLHVSARAGGAGKGDAPRVWYPAST